MYARKVKDYVKAAARKAGYEIIPRHWKPGTQQRPVGSLVPFLEDCRARGFSPKTIVDIGANRAEWAAMAKQVFPTAHVLLFEPLAEFAPRLEAFCAGNPGSRYFPVALGAAPGSLEMLVHNESNLDGSTLWGQAEKGKGHAGNWRMVAVETLDKLADEGNIVSTPDVIKIDVQGFELEVLKGARKALSGTAMFILEVSFFEFWAGQPIFSDVISFMLQHGYCVYDIPGTYRRKLDGALGQVDLAFVPISSPLRSSSLWDPPA